MKRLLAACAALAVASCDDVSLHILTAQPYQAPGSGQATGCLLPGGAIDVVGGAATADNCDPTCLVAGSGDAQSVYFTTACGPYPDYTAETQDQLDGAADPCVGVFAALAADAQCVPGDGGDAEAAPGDDGGDGEASGDDGGGSDGGGGEAGGDASSE